MKTWTVDEMLAERPCAEWMRERLLEIAGGKERVSLLEIVLDERISDADAIWCATRPGALTERQRKTWLNRIVGFAVERYALKCGVLEVEKWAERWLSGANRSNSAAYAAANAAYAAASAAAAAAPAAADAAAYAAANAVYARAAYAAARAAAYAAAYAAANAAAAYAAAHAAADAAADAAKVAARTEQRACLLEVL